MAKLIRKALIIIFLASSFIAKAQTGKVDTVRIENGGDYLASGQKDSLSYIKFVGSPSNRVIFKQKDTRIFSDSAYLYKAQNMVEAFGSVKVIHQDTINVTGRKLIYKGNIKLARMIGDAKYVDPTLTISSDTLQYDMINDLASYFHDGKLRDERNTLTSEVGYYYNRRDLATFKKDVKLVNPDYVLYADTLHYNTLSKVAIFKGPTTVISQSDSTVLTFLEGKYETTQKQSTFGRGQIETNEYILSGDTLFFDDLNQYYSASRNVKLVSKEELLIITGDYGKYWKDRGITKMFGDPIMKKPVPRDQDTLFLAADTLVAIENEFEEKKRLLAYHDVKVFKTDLQGIADSMSYHSADSVIFLYNDPVLWHEKTQIEADSINIEITERGIDRLNMNTNSFLITLDTLENPNQIKGRKMTAYFVNNELKKLDVNGNAENLIYALDETETAVIGINNVLCSNTILRFLNSQFDNASFYINPESTFTPPHELKKEDKWLNGYSWRISERPTKMTIYRMELPEVEKPELKDDLEDLQDIENQEVKITN